MYLKKYDKQSLSRISEYLVLYYEGLIEIKLKINRKIDIE